MRCSFLSFVYFALWISDSLLHWTNGEWIGVSRSLFWLNLSPFCIAQHIYTPGIVILPLRLSYRHLLLLGLKLRPLMNIIILCIHTHTIFSSNEHIPIPHKRKQLPQRNQFLSTSRMNSNTTIKILLRRPHLHRNAESL